MGGQYITGPGGAITLNLLAIDKSFDYHNIDQEDRLELSNQIQELAAECIASQERKAEADRKLAENKRR